MSCRGADLASTAPRSQEDAPSCLPQPKLNTGAPALAGAACSRRTASGTFPSVVQALTVHWADCPSSLLACARATSTQRLTCAAGGTVVAPLPELVPVGVSDTVGVDFAVGTGSDDEAAFAAVGVAGASRVLA